MSFADIALIGLVALLGPLLAAPKRWRAPIVVGELVGGILVGRTGLAWLDPTEPTFTFLADMGFALTMFVAGTHVPLRDKRLRSALGAGALRALGVGVLATVAAVPLAHHYAPGATGLLAVVLASSSAALVVPVVTELRLDGPQLLPLLAQVAIADTACIVALPLAIDPDRAPRAALGAAAICVAGVVLFLVLRALDRRDLWDRLRDESRQHKFALELRISLVILASFAALAHATHVSFMLAGFVVGLAVSAAGEPHRLAKQLFAVTEGFFGPLFFVWLGASLTLRSVARHPDLLVFGLLLGAVACLIHVAMRLTGQPIAFGALAGGQLGVPAAAATLGPQTGIISQDVATSLLIGAVVTIAAVTVAARLAAGKEPATVSG